MIQVSLAYLHYCSLQYYQDHFAYYKKKNWISVEMITEKNFKRVTSPFCYTSYLMLLFVNFFIDSRFFSFLTDVLFEWPLRNIFFLQFSFVDDVTTIYIEMTNFSVVYWIKFFLALKLTFIFLKHFLINLRLEKTEKFFQNIPSSCSFK